MSTPVRVGGFVVALLAVFGLAFGVGRVADPDTAPVAEHESTEHSTGEGDMEGHGGHEAADAAAEVHLSLAARSFAPGDAVPVSFQVQDHAGEPVTSYDVKHEKELHLIVLGTGSLTDFQHVHPTRAADGTWSVPLRLAPGTSYRMYADGSTEGADFVATADISTNGDHSGADPIPTPAPTDSVDGFSVALEQGDGAATLRVTRAGARVELEPYLGALGHLVVIRADDLSYLHVHPEEADAPVFAVSGLAPGRYRYFFDFQVEGVVRTAAFTVDVGTDASMEEDDDEHSH